LFQSNIVSQVLIVIQFLEEESRYKIYGKSFRNRSTNTDYTQPF